MCACAGKGNTECGLFVKPYGNNPNQNGKQDPGTEGNMLAGQGWEGH